MKKRILPSMFAFVALHAGALFGQDVTGTWQGTIHTTRDIREVISISKDGDTLKAVLFSIDLDPGQNFPSPPVILQRNSIKIQFPGIGGEYNGTLSADGNSIVGSFFQGSRMSSLNLSRATVGTAWEIPYGPPPRKTNGCGCESLVRSRQHQTQPGGRPGWRIWSLARRPLYDP